MFNFLLKFTICLKKHLINYFDVLFNCFIIHILLYNLYIIIHYTLIKQNYEIIYKNVLLTIFLTFFS